MTQLSKLQTLTALSMACAMLAGCGGGDAGVPPPPGPAWPNFLVRFTDAYRAELAAFLSVVRGEISSPCTARDGVESLRIAEAATRSLHEHRPVALTEVPGLGTPETMHQKEVSTTSQSNA